MAAAQTDFGLSQIGQVAIRVHDLNRAVEFYRERLGMRFLFSAPPGLAFFQCGDVTLMLSGAETPEFDHPASVIYFTVEDIDHAYRTLLGRGVEFRDEPHLIHRAESYDLWMAFFRDLEENTFAIMARKPRG